MQTILDILNENNETKIEKYIDGFLNKTNDFFIDYLNELSKKIDITKVSEFEKLVRYFSQNLYKNGKEYSLFMIPVIKDFVNNEPLKSVDVMQILIENALDNENVVLIDNWVSYQDILQEPSVFRQILKDVSNNIIDGPTYLDLNNLNLEDYNKPIKRDFFNYDTYHMMYTKSQKEEKIISLKFIVGIIVRPKRKKLNILTDIINRKEDSEYQDTGLHGILLSDHFNNEQNNNFIYEKEKNDILYNIHKINEKDILLVCEPGNPLDIVQAVTQYESFILIHRIQYYKTLYSKIFAHMIYNETDNILYIMFFCERDNTGVLTLFDTMELICSNSIAEIYASVLENFIQIKITDNNHEIFKLYERFLKTIH